MLLALITLITTVLISVIQTTHEFSYSFLLKDFLSKRDAITNHLDLVFFLVFALLFAWNIPSSVVLLAHIILSSY